MSKIILFSITFLAMIIFQNNSKVNDSLKVSKNITALKPNKYISLKLNKDVTEINSNTKISKKEPKEIVLSLFNDYFIPIKEKDASENEKLFVSAIKEIIGKYFDIKKIVNKVLGPNKNKFSDSEKEEFTELLTEKMSIVYGRQFSEFEDIKNFEINDVKNSNRTDNKKCSVVISSVTMKGEKIDLLWYFLEDDNHEMKIIDIKVARISLTLNWSAQVKALLLEYKEIRKFLDNFK